MTSIIRTNTLNDMLKHSYFEPVFDGDGNIVAISELKVSTDRRRGIEAMKELFESSAPGDDVIDADGWTGKQRRLLASPAPAACHYLKPSQRWDAKTGTMVDAMLIQLPFEVVWAGFDLLFAGQYSVTIKSTEHETEEISPVSVDHKGDPADDAPGRRFYSRATVAITIRLKNGSERTYEGMGVAYGDLSTGKTGNIFSINSTLRTADKGAIVDAKREALSTMGRMFRRAFDDGDEMIEQINTMLLQEIQDRNKPAIHRPAVKPAAVPPPAARASKPASVEKAADFVSITVPGFDPIAVNKRAFEEEFIAILVAESRSESDVAAILEANKDAVDSLISDAGKTEIADLSASLRQEPQPDQADDEDGIPDFSAPEKVEPQKDLEIPDAGKLTGKVILGKLVNLLAQAKDKTTVGAIRASNSSALRKLTAKQIEKFNEACQERLLELKG